MQEWCTVLNSSTCEAEAGRSLSHKPACSTELVSGQSVLHRETLSQNNNNDKANNNKTLLDLVTSVSFITHVVLPQLLCKIKTVNTGFTELEKWLSL